MAAQPWLQELTWRELIVNSILLSRRMKKVSKSYLPNSPLRVGFPVMLHSKPQNLFMKEVNLDIRFSHTFGAGLDNPELIVACVLGDDELSGKCDVYVMFLHNCISGLI